MINAVDKLAETRLAIEAIKSCGHTVPEEANEILEILERLVKAESLVQSQCIDDGTGVREERMLKWFSYSHLPEHLQAASKPFGDLAAWLVENVASGPERTVALRKLLEAKDAAVRAKLNPGS